MSTPIRVRGKNTRDQSRKVRREAIEKDPSTKPRGRPLKLVSSTIPDSISSSRSTSPSINLHLSSAKRRKTKAGTTPQTKPRMRLSPLESLPVELLQTIFLQSLNVQLPLASPSLAAALSNEHVYTELTLRAFASIVSEDGYVPLYPEFNSGTLRTMIMSRRWFTLDLIRKCRAKLLQHASEWDQPGKSWRVVHIEHKEHIMSNPQPIRTIRTILSTPQGLGIRRHQVISFGETIEQTSTTYFEPVQSYSADQSDMIWKAGLKDKHYYLPDCLAGPHGEESDQSLLPERLLHGPWTEEKLYLLGILFDAGARVDWVNTTTGEVAESGLEEAILERNRGAVELLTRPRRHSVYTCVPTNMNLGVRVDKKHLRLAVLKAGCDLTVVEALLHHKWIPLDDELVLDWAVKARAEGNEKGQQLLDLLDRTATMDHIGTGHTRTELSL
ncbi:magnesium ion transporter [Acarospora aff. strigata]|nr:magnesium ion transporter [Acarospora aff. strigata]